MKQTQYNVTIKQYSEEKTKQNMEGCASDAM